MYRLAAVFLLLLAATPASAKFDSLWGGGMDPALDSRLERQWRQFAAVSTHVYGVALDAQYTDAGFEAAVKGFLDQPSDDFAAVTGKPVNQWLAAWDEQGDLGMFGGVGIAATAYRYLVLKREGGDAAGIAAARALVVRAIETWHVMVQITGTPGVIARGVYRLVPEDPTDAPIPGLAPTPVPLADENGQPLPQPKDNGTWRADNSQDGPTPLPPGEWMWVDSASKDQLSGYVFGLVALYDAAKDDPDIDQGLVNRMEADAAAIGAMLREKWTFKAIDGKQYEYDLVIRDADGRPTKFHDCNPYMLEGLKFVPGGNTSNLFNTAMGLAIVKGLHHVGGDPAIEKFYYEELLGVRRYHELLLADKAINYITAGALTNFSNMNMIAVASWLMVYLETDPELAAVYQQFLEARWWDKPGESRSARWDKQPFYSALYLGMAGGATQDELVQATVRELKAFRLGPYLTDDVQNCDASETAALKCTLLDGTQIDLVKVDDGGKEVFRSKDKALDPAIRPSSNYTSRSDPFDLNGNKWGLLNSGGDLLAAYWLLRWLPVRAQGEQARSPLAREHLAIPQPGEEPVAEQAEAAEGTPAEVMEAVETAPGADVEQDAVAEETPVPNTGSRSSCEVGGRGLPVAAALWLLALLPLAAGRFTRRGSAGK